MSSDAPAERVLKDIRRATRKHYSAEDKFRIVLDGLRGEGSIDDLCRRESSALKEVVAEQALEIRLLKKA
jgi:transposase